MLHTHETSGSHQGSLLLENSLRHKIWSEMGSLVYIGRTEMALYRIYLLQDAILRRSRQYMFIRKLCNESDMIRLTWIAQWYIWWQSCGLWVPSLNAFCRGFVFFPVSCVFSVSLDRLVDDPPPPPPSQIMVLFSLVPFANIFSLPTL